MPQDSNPPFADIGDRLRAARKNAQMTQDSVSKQLGDGFSLASLYRWENGTELPRFDRIGRLADLYGVSLDWIAGRTPLEPVLVPGKVVVDQDALEALEAAAAAGKRLEDLPSWLLRPPGFNVASKLPKRLVLMNEDAMFAIETRLQRVRRTLGGQG